MWLLFNKIFNALKKFPLFKLLYKIAWAPSAYHFCIAIFGALLYRFPSRSIRVIGITGTKGKTTVVELLSAIFEASGKKVATLSSLRVKTGNKEEKNTSGNTMPGRFFVQNFLRRAVRARCDYAIVEVTSQGVVLHRHKQIRWASALITNIHPEHIESHGSFDRYRDAKLAFLKYVASQGGGVFVNGDDAPSKYFTDSLPKKSVTIYSADPLLSLSPGIEEFLPGAFNKQNISAAVSLARSLGVSDEAITKAMEAFRGVPGRMEFVQKEPFAVVVDYAHTPDSLEAVYKTLRSQILSVDGQMSASGRLLCVLGSAGGGRDKWKRPEMGRIAAEYCDEVILTNEDPWDEKPEVILEQVAAGFSRAAKRENQPVSYRRIVDRKEAVRSAVQNASPGDAVIITGKGSEPFLHGAKGEKIPWSDVECARSALKGKK